MHLLILGYHFFRNKAHFLTDLRSIDRNPTQGIPNTEYLGFLVDLCRMTAHILAANISPASIRPAEYANKILFCTSLKFGIVKVPKYF